MCILTVLMLVFCMSYTCNCQKTTADRIEQCPNNRGTFVEIRNVKLYRKSDKPEQFFDYDLHATKPVSFKGGLIKATELKRCPKKDSDKGCANLPIFKLKNVCDLIHVPSLLIERFLNCLDKEVICSVEKGLYKGRNCSIDMNKFKLVNLGRHFWSGRIELIKGKEIVLCMTGQVHME